MIQHRIKEREPQYMDMKEIITEAARKLVLEKKVKKLTVKDIVEECQITRQAFYYHFEGIPDLIQWSIKQGTRRLLEACKEQGGAEAALKYLFVFAINAIPEVRKGIESNYGKDSYEQRTKKMLAGMIGAGVMVAVIVFFSLL